MHITKSFIFPIWAGVSFVWILAGSVGSAVTWSQSMEGIHAIYKQREKQCISRYSDPSARDRCLQIMRLERFQAQSISIFNRVLLIACPPLIGLGLVFFLYRRPPPRTTRHRRDMRG